MITTYDNNFQEILCSLQDEGVLSFCPVLPSIPACRPSRDLAPHPHYWSRSCAALA